MSVLLYLALLPLSVWILAGAFALFDGPSPSAAVKALCWRLFPLLLLAWGLGPGAAQPLVLALLTALILHVTAVTGLRVALQRGLLHRLGQDRDGARSKD